MDEAYFRLSRLASFMIPKYFCEENFSKLMKSINFKIFLIMKLIENVAVARFLAVLILELSVFT